MKPQGYYNIISGIVIAGLIIALILCGKACNSRPQSCPEVRTTTEIKYRDTGTHHIVTRPVLVATHTTVHDTVISVQTSTGPCEIDLSQLDFVLPSDTNDYRDSIYLEGIFKAAIHDQITANRIAHRSIYWAQLGADSVQHTKETILKRPGPVSLYVGAIGSFNQTPQDGGPAVLLTINGYAAVGYSYQPRHNLHGVSLFANIPFKKP